MTGDRDPSVLDAAADAFGVLADETRLAIVAELATHRRTNWRRNGLRFADLRRAVGVRDSGTFNHHLDALDGHFVEQRGDEYVLTEAGLLVADAVLAGVYAGPDDSRRSTSTDQPCGECRTPLTAVYEDERLSLECDDHGVQAATAIPRGALDGRTMDELLDVAALDIQQDLERAAAGVCFHCWGRMRTAIQVDAPFRHPVTGDAVEPDTDGPLAVFGCERCGTVFWSHPFGCVFRHPALAAFAHERAIDYPPTFGFAAFLRNAGTTTVRETEPVRLELTVAGDDEELVFTLDETGDILEYEHRYNSR